MWDIDQPDTSAAAAENDIGGYEEVGLSRSGHYSIQSSQEQQSEYQQQQQQQQLGVTATDLFIPGGATTGGGASSVSTPATNPYGDLFSPVFNRSGAIYPSSPSTTAAAKARSHSWWDSTSTSSTPRQQQQHRKNFASRGAISPLSRSMSGARRRSAETVASFSGANGGRPFHRTGSQLGGAVTGKVVEGEGHQGEDAALLVSSSSSGGGTPRNGYISSSLAAGQVRGNDGGRGNGTGEVGFSVFDRRGHATYGAMEGGEAAYDGGNGGDGDRDDPGGRGAATTSKGATADDAVGGGGSLLARRPRGAREFKAGAGGAEAAAGGGDEGAVQAYMSVR